MIFLLKSTTGVNPNLPPSCLWLVHLLVAARGLVLFLDAAGLTSAWSNRTILVFDLCSSSSSTRSSSSLLDSMDWDSWSFSTSGRFGRWGHTPTNSTKVWWKSGPVRSVCVQHAEFLDSMRTEWEPEPSALKLHSCGCSASALEAADSGHSRSLKSLLFDKAFIEGWLRLAHS